MSKNQSSTSRYIESGEYVQDTVKNQYAAFGDEESAREAAAWMNDPASTPGDYQWEDAK